MNRNTRCAGEADMMLYLSARLIGWLVIALSVAMVAAGTIGAGQPPNLATAGFWQGCEDKPQPCWYGIVPGITGGADAFRLLEEAGYQRTSITPARYGDEAHVYKSGANDTLCQTILQYNPNKRHIQRIQLSCTNIRFGDMIAAKGTPAGIQKTSGYAPRLLFTGNVSAIESVEIDTTSLFSRFGSIDLRAASSSDEVSPTFGWHGLAPLWRYCALESAPICAALGTS
ncbi:MAG: hypothetical protein K8I30_12640 [Anaerolineae bacterium]|nr:hypothetical protein [Anaerolineae bacterium]